MTDEIKDSGKWVVITPEGQITAEEFDSSDTLNEFYRLIGCDTVDVVGLAPNLDMWVDDNGMVTGQPVNPLATGIAATFGLTYQPYVGTAIFARSDDEGETIGLDEEMLTRLLAIGGGQ